MTLTDEIMQLCEAYIAEAEKLERERKPADGLFGMGKKPADDPCHDRFAKDIEAKLGEAAAQSPSSAEVREALSYIYHLPKEHKEPLSIYWLLNAVHGLTLPLIGFLDADDAGALRKQYASELKRWERLPVQKQVYAALSKK